MLGADGDKRRQVDAFLRSADAVLRRATKAGVLPDGPLRVVDLGCGNAYLTLAAHRYLSDLRPGTRTVGVELRPDLVARSTERAGRAGLEGLSFVPGTIAEADPTDALGGPPHVVLALHACDTATDEALARAVRWQAPVVLAAPCCHHDVQRQLADGTPPEPYAALTRHPILRERFADVLTDALRSLVLRRNGYRVEVVEFVDSVHTPAQRDDPRGPHRRRRPSRGGGRVRRPGAAVGRRAGPGADAQDVRRSTTWSMQAVRARTSSGSIAGNIAIRSWLRPSLR